ncbi:MAG: diguanylate cyclase [Leptospiraceae bacterium]|nr:MAG: diguanylate cyclase [Leptospiraceae bacterium]GIX43550.1 MAG: diguanylate cyclase [Leptospiraceae bacterium]
MFYWYKELYKTIMTIREWEERVNAITFAFQPIIDLRAKRIFGFEALLRNYEDAGFSKIFDIFDLAFKNKVLYGLDLLLREKLLSLFVQLPDYQKRRILYNIDNRILEMPDFESGNTNRLLRKYNLVNSSFIFEISERLPFQSYESLSKIIYNYRNQGFKIAIDDFGVGYSSLQLIYSTEPDILKLDRFFIYNINHDLRKKLFVEEIVKITHLIGGIVIAEGVETYDELLTCLDIGIDLAQGFYICEPFFIEEYDKKISKVKELLYDLELNFYAYITKKEKDISVKQLDIKFVPPISISMSFEEILEHFNQYSEYYIFPVVNEYNEPLGIIKEKDYKKYFLDKYTRDLLKYKDFSDVLKKHITKAFILESDTEIQNFFDLISHNEFFDEKVLTEIIVTEQGKYKGIIFSDSILKYVFQQKLLFAKESNPLTNLPGNKAIRKYIKDHQKFIGTFAIIYLDIDHFKPFNDLYGFEQGDKLIFYLGNLLKSYLQDKEHYFIGHVGGDDFILFIKNRSLFHILKIICSIKKEFCHYLNSILNDKDISNGYFIAKNRFGIEQKFELPSLSIGILFLKNGEIPLDKLSYLIADVKNKSKLSEKKIFYKIL